MKTILKCKKCKNKSQDVQQNPHAWDGWVITPFAVCASCIDLELAAREVKTNKVATLKLAVAGQRG